MNTKDLTGPQVPDILEQMGHKIETGRNSIAPELAMVVDKDFFTNTMLELLSISTDNVQEDKAEKLQDRKPHSAERAAAEGATAKGATAKGANAEGATTAH